MYLTATSISSLTHPAVKSSVAIIISAALFLAGCAATPKTTSSHKGGPSALPPNFQVELQQAAKKQLMRDAARSYSGDLSPTAVFPTQNQTASSTTHAKSTTQAHNRTKSSTNLSFSSGLNTPPDTTIGERTVRGATRTAASDPPDVAIAKFASAGSSLAEPSSPEARLAGSSVPTSDTSATSSEQTVDSAGSQAADLLAFPAGELAAKKLSGAASEPFAQTVPTVLDLLLSAGLARSAVLQCAFTVPRPSNCAPMRVQRVTGGYLDVVGTQHYAVRSGTRVQVLGSGGDVIAQGVVTTVKQSGAVVELDSRRGYEQLQPGQEVVVLRR